jgi:putative Mn2+ efflux pump MntP
MDATAVAAARGFATPTVRLGNTAMVALLFGGSQALMSTLGWLTGAAVGEWVASWDHWVAFVLLTGLGMKMLHAALRRDEEAAADAPAWDWLTMGLLAVATSVDALAAGITLPMMDARLALSAGVIGLVTAVLSGAGLHVGRRLGRALGPRLELAGGFVLAGLGTKILLEHTGVIALR